MCSLKTAISQNHSKFRYQLDSMLLRGLHNRRLFPSRPAHLRERFVEPLFESAKEEIIPILQFIGRITS